MYGASIIACDSDLLNGPIILRVALFTLCSSFIAYIAKNGYLSKSLNLPTFTTMLGLLSTGANVKDVGLGMNCAFAPAYYQISWSNGLNTATALAMG